MDIKRILLIGLGLLGIGAAVYGLLQNEVYETQPPEPEDLEEEPEEAETIEGEPELTIVASGEVVPPDSNDRRIVGGK